MSVKIPSLLDIFGQGLSSVHYESFLPTLTARVTACDTRNVVLCVVVWRSKLREIMHSLILDAIASA